MASTSQGAATPSAADPSASSGAAKAQDPVEMSTLPSPSQEGATAAGADAGPTQDVNNDADEAADTVAGAQQQSEPTTTSSTKPPPPTNRLTRAQSEALGPATDSPIHPPPPNPTDGRGPTLSITLMLITGARHPYKIDEKYLRSRKVDVTPPTITPASTKKGESNKDASNTAAGRSEGFDPRDISGYKLKELIWTDWRGEWEPRPASPSSIRLIILGRLVEDKMALRDFPFKLDDTNVVHMSVKPADFLDDDDAGGKGAGKGHSIRGRDDGERGAGCRCVIL